jgi:hypothetical protein
MPYSVSTSRKSLLATSQRQTVAVKDQAGLLARMTFEPHHAQCVDDDIAHRILAQAPPDHLTAE